MNGQPALSEAGLIGGVGFRRSIGWIIALLAVWLLQMPLAHGASKVVASTVHIVSIQNMQFVPAVLTIRLGDKVTWVNNDLVPHTASASDSQFDSGNIPVGGSWTYTAKEEGALGYACRYHPGMQATLKVQ